MYSVVQRAHTSTAKKILLRSHLDLTALKFWIILHPFLLKGLLEQYLYSMWVFLLIFAKPSRRRRSNPYDRSNYQIQIQKIMLRRAFSQRKCLEFQCRSVPPRVKPREVQYQEFNTAESKFWEMEMNKRYTWNIWGKPFRTPRIALRCLECVSRGGVRSRSELMNEREQKPRHCYREESLVVNFFPRISCYEVVAQQVHYMRPAKCSFAYCSQAYWHLSIQSSRRYVPAGVFTLAGLPTLAPITFHLFVSYSLIALRRAWL